MYSRSSHIHHTFLRFVSHSKIFKVKCSQSGTHVHTVYDNTLYPATATWSRWGSSLERHNRSFLLAASIVRKLLNKKHDHLIYVKNLYIGLINLIFKESLIILFTRINRSIIKRHIVEGDFSVKSKVSLHISAPILALFLSSISIFF